MKKALALALAGLSLNAYSASYYISSPDEKLKVEINDDTGKLFYQVHYQDKLAVPGSRLGMRFQHAPSFDEGLKVIAQQSNAHSSTWEQPWGEAQWIEDNHNRLTMTVQNQSGETFQLVFKVFNDGLGFRYEIAENKAYPTRNIIDEITEFRFPEAHKTEAWWIPSRGWNRYEYLYQHTKLEDFDRVHTPLTLKLDNGLHISVHEAALTNYASMTLDQQRGGILKADLTPWSDGIKVKTQGAFKTPWRTLQITPAATGLLNSRLILNLNEPNKLGDVSWVKPGKYIGIWWGMHIGTQTWYSGDKHGANTQTTKEYLDFAADHGFDGVLVEGWNLGWDGEWFNNGDVFSFTQSYPDFDIEALSAYGLEKGVRLIGHHETSGSVTNYRKQMADAFDLYERLGVTQVKTGYVADGGNIKAVDEKGRPHYEWHDGQFMVNEYLHSVTEAAKRKISINTHEPIKDTGLRRTYPNWITREGARGQEFNAWGQPPNSPGHTVDLVYTRMLSGPMDFTPGIFNIEFHGKDASTRTPTTLAKQLALYVVLYSPIQMAADLPENYEKNLPAFQFIKDVPADWAESIAINGKLSEFATFVRKDKQSGNWYLGSITNEKARSLKVPLDFLEPGAKYRAEIYRDGDDAHWRNNPTSIDISNKTVSSLDSLALELAAGGGVAIRFVKL